MIRFVKALRARRRALRECEQARWELHGCVDTAAVAYTSHPLPALAGAAGVGFALAQMRVGGGLVKTGLRIATGPAWVLLREVIHQLE